MVNKNRGHLKPCAIDTSKAPHGVKVGRKVAAFTGAKIFGDEAGLTLGYGTLSELGQVAKVEASEDRITLFPKLLRRGKPRPLKARSSR